MGIITIENILSTYGMDTQYTIDKKVIYMNNFLTTLSLDDAFDCYEMSKRTISDTPLFYYDFTANEFIKIKSAIKNPGVVFINSYKLCSRLIDEYLNQPKMNEYKILFENKTDASQNKIIRFLWFFEEIDGCYDFQKFEISKVTKELIKWCKNNGINYSKPEIYRID